MPDLKVILSLFAALFLWSLISTDKFWALTLRDAIEVALGSALATIPTYYLYTLVAKRRKD